MSKHGFTPTSIETLGEQLAKEYPIIFASDKKDKIWRILDMCWVLLVNSFKIKLVLIDTYSTQNFWYAYLIARLAKLINISYIPILRGGNLPNRLKASPKALKSIFENAYKIITPSFYLYRIFKEQGFITQVIPNYINIGNYPYLERELLLPKLLWVRSFHKIYNPTLAIEILNKLKKGYPDAILGMVGPFKDESIKEVKKMIADYKLQDSVIITGTLSKKEWIKFAKDYNIFINTSNYDNQPVTLIEAMALGLPIVTTNVGGIPDLIENDTEALFAYPEDTSSFVGKIYDLLKAGIKAKKMVSAARTKAESFDWKNVKPEWDKLLQGLNN